MVGVDSPLEPLAHARLPSIGPLAQLVLEIVLNRVELTWLLGLTLSSEHLAIAVHL